MKVFQLICNFEIYQVEWSVSVHVSEKAMFINYFRLRIYREKLREDI